MYIDIKKVEEKTGLSLHEIEEKIGCCYQWLVNVKKPKHFPKTLKTLVKLSEISGLTIDELIKK